MDDGILKGDYDIWTLGLFFFTGNLSQAETFFCSPYMLQNLWPEPCTTLKVQTDSNKTDNVRYLKDSARLCKTQTCI